MKSTIVIIMSVMAFVGMSFAPVMPKDIVELAMSSPDHTTLVKALKSAGLVNTLKGKGPFTVFAPTDAAFAKLPPGTTDNLMMPAQHKAFVALLTYHVVPGKIMAKDLMADIKKGHGKTMLTTVEGEKLAFSMDGDKVKITDAKGGTAYVTATDMVAGNGVIHSIDTVLMPK